MVRVGFRWLVLPLVGLLATAIAWSEFRALRAVDPADPLSSRGSVQASQPWSGWAGLRLARLAESFWRLDPPGAEAMFSWHLSRYPLDRDAWHDLAVVSRHLDRDRSVVLAHLEAAVAVQPGHRETRWRAATLAQLLGDDSRAEAHLRRWLEGQPSATGQALFAGSRWIHDPDAQLERLLPAGEEYLAAAVAYARRHHRLDLAKVAWKRLSQPRDPDDPVLLDFIDLALAQGDFNAAMAAWQLSFPDYRPGEVPNADFRHPLGVPRGLHWGARMPAGAEAQRDLETFVRQPASLRIDFDGSENLRLRQPRLRIPLAQPGDGWVLSGYWRGEGLTTRALPYLNVWLDGGRHARLDVPGASFDWTPFRIELMGSEESRLMHLQLRRDPPSQDFDRFLAGSLWLDALRIQPLADPHAPGQAPNEAASPDAGISSP